MPGRAPSDLMVMTTAAPAAAALLLLLSALAPPALAGDIAGTDGSEEGGRGHGIHLQARPPQVRAPGYGRLAFEAPAPGTYRLPAFGDAADGDVLLSTGEAVRLHDLMGDRLVVLSFVYTRCPDPNGCPLATYVLRRLQRRLSEEPALAGQVRLLSLSFDPAWDTPAVMARYAADVLPAASAPAAGAEEAVATDSQASGAGDGSSAAPAPPGASEAAVPWHFLTTASRDALAPILRAYDQTVIEARDEDGNPVGSYSHILRVYLIDRERRLRNIYSVPFLHPDILTADLLTLLDAG